MSAGRTTPGRPGRPGPPGAAGRGPARRGCGRLLLAAGLLVIAAPSWARPGGAAGDAPAGGAAEAPRVGVISLTLRGIAADQERRYHDILRAELKRAGYEVVEERETRRLLERLGAPPNCIVGPCLQQVGGALGAQRVLVGGVLVQGSNYDVNLTFLETAGGTPVAQAMERCEVCTSDEGIRAFARVIASLTGRAPSRTAGGRPPPQVVWQATTPWYQEPRWRIGTLAVGLGAVATGAALLALDGSCTGGTNCPRNFEFTIPGVTLIGVGALMTSAAVAMFLLRSPARPAPRLAFGVGPRGLQLCGRF